MESSSLSQNLRKALEQEGDGDIALGKILSNVGEGGFGLLLMALSLPSALPVPAAGYSTPFGIAFIILGAQMMIGRHEPWLPQKATRCTLSRSFADKLLSSAARFFNFIEKLVHPRMNWINSRGGMSLMSGVVIVMACLMILPIPLTNTFPAMVIFCIGVGLTEKDGLFSLGACALGVVSIVLYATLIYYALTMGWEVFDHVKDWFRSLFLGSETTEPATPQAIF